VRTVGGVGAVASLRREREAKKPRIGVDKLSFGARLKILCREKGVTPTQLAAKIGMSTAGIARYESNQASEPEFFNGLAIADALAVSPYKLAGMDEPGIDVTIELTDALVLVQIKAMPKPEIGQLDKQRIAAIQQFVATALAAHAPEIATPPALASETAPPSDPRIPELVAKVNELAEGFARLAAQSPAGSKASRRRRPKSA